VRRWWPWSEEAEAPPSVTLTRLASGVEPRLKVDKRTLIRLTERHKALLGSMGERGARAGAGAGAGAVGTKSDKAAHAQSHDHNDDATFPTAAVAAAPRRCGMNPLEEEALGLRARLGELLRCAAVAGTHSAQLVQVGAILEVAGGALATAAERVEREQVDLREARRELSSRIGGLHQCPSELGPSILSRSMWSRAMLSHSC
jgi:hypothetical protein